MSEIASLFTIFLKSGTPVGYILCAIGLVGVWKMTAIVPTLMDSWEKRNDGIEARLQAGMKEHIERTNKFLEEADKAHKDCQDEQVKLRALVNDQNGVIATQNKTIAELTATNVKLSGEVAALKASHMQTQITFVEEKGEDASPAMHGMITKLREIK